MNKYEHLVRRKHLQMIVGTIGTAIGAPTGIILMYAWGSQLNKVLTNLAVWLFLGAGVGLIVLYFLFLIGVVAWVHFKKRNQHDH